MLFCHVIYINLFWFMKSAQPSDETFMQSMKKVREWEASNSCTSCGSLNWKCECKLVNIEEMREAMEAFKGPSTPIKTQPEETLLSFLNRRFLGK